MTFTWSKLPPELLTRNAKRITATTGIGIVLALIYALVAPNWYESTLSAVPATPAKGAGLGTQLAGALGGVLEAEFGVNADVERIAAVFQSTSVTDAVIRKFDLMNRYDTRYIERTRKILWAHCNTHIERKARIVFLICEDTNPQFVKKMLEYFGEYGNDVFRRVSTSSASEEVRFLEQRVAEMRKEADDAARKLRDFEERYKIVDLEAQSKAVVSAMASLRSQEISKELQISYINTFTSRDEATAVQLRQQLAVMSAKFRKMEEPPSAEDSGSDASKAASENRGSTSKGADIFPAAMAVPRLRFELEQLYRDKKIRETDLLLLMQRLEMAKVNEARDTSAFQILDAPALPTYKIRPRLSIALCIGLFVGLSAGLAWVFAPTYVRNARNRPHPMDSLAERRERLGQQ